MSHYGFISYCMALPGLFSSFALFIDLYIEYTKFFGCFHLLIALTILTLCLSPPLSLSLLLSSLNSFCSRLSLVSVCLIFIILWVSTASFIQLYTCSIMWRGLLQFVFLIQLWTLTPGFADNGCSGFGNLENGQTFFRYGGLYVTFTCNPGFRIHGYRASSCVSGQWARNPPLCVASGCPSPGNLLHGSSVMSQDRSLSFFCCDSGFRLFGSALLYCKGKIWNGTKPVCKAADITSVTQEASRLNVNLQSHLNTLAVTAPKAFHKSALLGFPHIKPDFQGHKQENIKKTLEIKPLKKLWSDKTQHKGAAADVLKEPINHLENVKDPFRNTDIQKPLLVDSSNVTTISSSHLGASFQVSSFTTPQRDTQVKESTAKIIDQTSYRGNEKDLQSTYGTDKPSQSTQVTIAPMYVPFNSHQTSNINPPDPNVTPTDQIQSVTFISKASYEATTISSPASPTTSSFGFMVHFLESTTRSTVSSNCSDICVTSSPSRTTERTSPRTEVLTVDTQFTSTVPLRKDTNDTNKVTNGFSRPVLLSHFLRNTTLSTSIDYRQENERSDGSDSPAWKDLGITRLPTREHRPVCPYPPLPSHGTFYFRSIKNPGPHQYKHYIQYACYPGYTLTSGDIYNYCQHSGQWSGKTPLCIALTPCSLNNGVCSQICQDIGQNRAQCLCKPGFLLLEDQRTCRDLDECVEQLHLCQQACENTLGSYRCSCNPGFQLSPDRTSCFSE
ncbi:serine/threonine-protein phosphatase with EF-hands 1 isoform X3 [Triplophysa rosa]|uniref:serine/threonine-protein phosphatase with EF-hands 1 isoform X3 n=1 Tax=Triplophysa rosa TaxID=992332 RepID=UPI002545E63D|nr:serine/threonine-protein phosphatase with EF-hands 1 isoform X3 [Triplophysa rosa]